MITSIRNAAIGVVGALSIASATRAQGLTINGLTQVTFTGGDAVKSTYRLRRAEVKVMASLGGKAQALMMADAVKGTLQDAYISMPVGTTTLDAGQQRLPLGYEGSMSASSIETVDRALMESDKSRFASFGDVREAGVTLKRLGRTVDYRLGVFNGSGETTNDVAKVGKAIVGSLAFRPAFLSGFRIGASGATSGSGAANTPTRDRLGVDARLERGPIAVQLEAMKGQDAGTRRLGRYALATFTASAQFKVVSRVDVWDPDLATDVYPATVGECDYLGGFTWLPTRTRLKVQVNVVHKTYTAHLGSPSTLVLSQLQASW